MCCCPNVQHLNKYISKSTSCHTSVINLQIYPYPYENQVKLVQILMCVDSTNSKFLPFIFSYFQFISFYISSNSTSLVSFNSRIYSFQFLLNSTHFPFLPIIIVQHLHFVSSPSAL